MHTKVVYQGAKALARIGCAVLRFNFRGVGRSAGTFSGGPGESSRIIESALDYMATRYPDARLWTRGVLVRCLDVARNGRARRPRHRAHRHRAAGRDVGLRAAVHVRPTRPVSTKPKFFVQGEADEVCPLEAMWAFYGKLPEPKELVVIDAADHLFDGQDAGSRRSARGPAGDFHG